MNFDPSRTSLRDQLQCVDEPTAAQELGTSLKTLQKYRRLGIGPDYSVIKREIIYRRPALAAWVEAGGVRQDQATSKK